MSTASPSSGLDSALAVLQTAYQQLPHPDPHTLAAAARQVTRMADEAELNALEMCNQETRATLFQKVHSARRAAQAARQAARQNALIAPREALLSTTEGANITGVNGSKASPADTLRASLPSSGMDGDARNGSMHRGGGGGGSGETESVRMAREINDALRRTSAVVADEVARSRAAGSILHDSSRRLRQTRDEHTGMQSTLRKGGKTLRRLRTSEAVANIAVIVSFAIFFLTAGYVASRRLRSSLVASVVVRPAASLLHYPFAVLIKGGGHLRRFGSSRGDVVPGDVARVMDQQLLQPGVDVKLKSVTFDKDEVVAAGKVATEVEGIVEGIVEGKAASEEEDVIGDAVSNIVGISRPRQYYCNSEQREQREQRRF